MTNRKVTRHDRCCQQCGKTPITGYKFCGAKCSAEFRRPKGQRVSPAARGRGPFTCGCCGKEYRTTRRRGEGEKYCSRECAYTDLKAWHAKARSVVWLPEYSQVWPCKNCGAIHKKKAGDYCSAACRREVNNRASKQNAARRHVSVERECSECGSAFATDYGDKRKKFCAPSCAKRHSQRIRRSKERARLKAATVEIVNPFKVFERDGWRCQMCGKKTPRERRGTRYTNAPELDHRTPLSKGGEHSYANTQCSCRQCNLSKSNANEAGQLPLLAA